MTASFGTNHAATVKTWTNKVFTQYLTGNTLSFLMGSSDTSPIRMMEPGDDMKGDTWKYHLVQALSGGIYGDGSLAGNEQQLSVYMDELTVRTVRNAHRVDDWFISSDNTRVNLAESARANLTDWLKERIRNDVLFALTGTIIDSTQTAAGFVGGSTGRAVGRTQYRALYGNATANYNATEATALGNIDSTNGKFNVDTIRMARDLALSSSATSKVRPASIDLMKGVPSESFIALIGTRQARDLEQDPTWRQQRFYKTEQDKAGLFNGAYYRGSIQGVDVFVIPEMPILAAAGASSIDVGQWLLLGSQAATVVYRMRPEFALRKEDDYGNTYGIAVTEIRGEKRNVFQSENFGVVHGFTAAVAD